MTALVIAIVLTLGVSGFCSLLEAFILSTTTAEIEGLKRRHPKLGERLQLFKTDIAKTSSAILTLNTIANTAGAVIVGALATQVIPAYTGYVTGMMVLGILILSEIFPKNLGVAYRRNLQVLLVVPLEVVRRAMWVFSVAAEKSVLLMVNEPESKEEEKEQEIILLAEKSAEEGALSDSERDLIANALRLDDLPVREIMTPRTVVTALEDDLTVEEVCRDFKNLPFGRLPVYHEGIDTIVGVVRRRDLLQAYADGKLTLLTTDLMHEVLHMPETASALQALQLFLQKHQQIAVVVDEYGSTAGVVTMEDIVEHLLGSEIYEESDVAIDMRELARKRADRRSRLTAQQSKARESGEGKPSAPASTPETAVVPVAKGEGVA